MQYGTPAEVAKALARHAPKCIESLLDPAVGNGVLLDPILNRLSALPKHVICIDSNKDLLVGLQGKFKERLGNSLRLINADFLEWSSPLNMRYRRIGFDCIVMNPPFMGRKNGLVKVDLGADFPGIGGASHFAPVEVAFVLRATKLLKPGGRLLAVVPLSLVGSITTRWARELLLRLGAVRYVHELPRFTFRHLEARTYLFIFERRRGSGTIVLCNHDLARPKRLFVTNAELPPEIRFDYSFHKAFKWHESLATSFPQLEWSKVTDVASIHRGSIDAVARDRRVLHTSHYRDGSWKLPNDIGRFRRDRSQKGVQKGDLLVKRVGRDCGRSIGKVRGHQGLACSDCILIIRPKEKALSARLLFALRVVLAWSGGLPLIQRTTGASYLTAKELSRLSIPLGLADQFPQEYAHYKSAVAERQIDAMLSIEHNIRRSLTTCISELASENSTGTIRY